MLYMNDHITICSYESGEKELKKVLKNLGIKIICCRYHDYDMAANSPLRVQVDCMVTLDLLVKIRDALNDSKQVYYIMQR